MFPINILISKKLKKRIIYHKSSLSLSCWVVGYQLWFFWFDLLYLCSDFDWITLPISNVFLLHSVLFHLGVLLFFFWSIWALELYLRWRGGLFVRYLENINNDDLDLKSVFLFPLIHYNPSLLSLDDMMILYELIFCICSSFLLGCSCVLQAFAT